MTNDHGIEHAYTLAERRLIGSLLHGGDNFEDVLASVAVTDIGDPRLRDVFAAIKSLAARGVLPEAARIVPEMLANGLATDHAAIATGLVAELLAEPLAIGVVGHACYYAQIVREGSIRRQARAVAARIGQAADGVSIDDLADTISEQLTELRAALCAAYVVEGERWDNRHTQKVDAKNSIYTPTEFAALGIAGLTSKNTVRDE